MRRRWSCTVVREAISAMSDREQPPLREEVVERHVRGCTSCAAYAASLRALGPRLRLEIVGEVPNAAPAVLRRILHPAWRRALWWGLPLAAGGTALPALVLGAFAHIHVDPAHLVTPCTHALVTAHRHLITRR